jgi:aspartyl-tRNA(Asn)/glutamyl-tRNA(Gln) amidotransferase subunit A
MSAALGDDLAWQSLADAADQIRRRLLSPVELTRALIDRIERLDPAINAFLRFTPEAALAEAKAAEAEISSGRYRGSLHGMPYALKDIIDYTGLPTTAHSKILIDNVAGEDAFVAARLRAAGGVHLGKLATHEFAIGGPSFDLPWPPARNPWNRDHFPGGSSSGSGAGLAAGFFAAALGTDTGGSVRNPAAMCGITGMKPTYGRVSRRGVVPLAQSLDHVGPMTRNVRDNALLLQVIAGYDPEDPGSADEPVDNYLAAIDAGVRGLRIGFVRHFYTEDFASDPEQVAAIEAALGVWRDAGAVLAEIRLPQLQVWNAPTRVIIAAEAFAVHERWLRERPEDYGARGRERLMQGALLRAVDYIQAQRQRSHLIRLLAEAMHGFDALVTVSSCDPAPRLDDDAELARTYERQARMPFNLTGYPALVIPAGFTKAQHLPLSLQIVGHPFEEATVYRVAQVYEKATGWVNQHPPLKE